MITRKRRKSINTNTKVISTSINTTREETRITLLKTANLPRKSLKLQTNFWNSRKGKRFYRNSWQKLLELMRNNQQEIIEFRWLRQMMKVKTSIEIDKTGRIMNLTESIRWLKRETLMAKKNKREDGKAQEEKVMEERMARKIVSQALILSEMKNWTITHTVTVLEDIVVLMIAKRNQKPGMIQL